MNKNENETGIRKRMNTQELATSSNKPAQKRSETILQAVSSMALPSRPVGKAPGFVSKLYDHNFEDVTKSTSYAPRTPNKKLQKMTQAFSRKPQSQKSDENSTYSSTPLQTCEDDVEAGNREKQQAEEEEETPQMNVSTSIALLAIVTVLVAVTAEWLVDSIDGMTRTGGINKEFVGIILLPIVGNAAEHATAVTVSVKDKLTLSIGVAVGSSIVRRVLST
ncbi:hypothetical protein C0992_005836 [Termitomyces sp. T32_za158]|nr:hypothetical protein C0992_005836 [Termitomyces sp. T32_za158]